MTEMEYKVYRMSFHLVFIEAAIIVFLFILLLSLFPLKETQFAFVQVSPKGEQVIVVEPLEKNTPAQELISEALGREYVILRETIDPVIDNIKINKLKIYSTPELFDAYEGILKDDTSSLNQFKFQNLKREVSIESSILLDEETLQINWKGIDRQADNGIVRSEKHFISLLKFSFKTLKIKNEAIYFNPLGFQVKGYTLRFRKAS